MMFFSDDIGRWEINMGNTLLKLSIKYLMQTWRIKQSLEHRKVHSHNTITELSSL